MSDTQTQTTTEDVPVGPPTLEDKVAKVIQTVYDPEIPVNIFELGLIYNIDANEEDGNVKVQMTLTTPSCPSAQELPVEVEHSVRSLPEVNDVHVEIVWEPTWTPDRMSEAARLQLGMF